MNEQVIPVVEVPFYSTRWFRVTALLLAIFAIIMCCCMPLAVYGWTQRAVILAPWQDDNSVPTTADDGDQRAVGPQGNESRVERLMRLDKVFRSNKSVAAWLEAAGMPFDWTAGYFDARQPEEETLSLPDGSVKIVLSGQQVDVRGLYVAYPSCFTTDHPDRALTTASTLKYTPDPSNGSTLYSNATTSGNGEVTVWVDCSNWSQLADPTIP